MAGFELTERQQDSLKKAVEDLRSEDRKDFGKMMLGTIMQYAAGQSDPKTAWHGIKMCLHKMNSATPDELYHWLGEPPQATNSGEIESDEDDEDDEFSPPRFYSDLAVMIIKYIHDDAGDEVEKVYHDDLGDHEVLRFNFSNGKTFQIDIREVEPTAIDERLLLPGGDNPEVN
jgi:hypothetical protein